MEKYTGKGPFEKENDAGPPVSSHGNASFDSMPTLFTKIINGELPGRFVWRDDLAVAFLTIAPIQPGHALIVPIQEVDDWLTASDDLRAHLINVAARIGKAQMAAFHPQRVGLIIAGLEVPHLHLHSVPINSEADLSFANADASASSEDLDAAASRLQTALDEIS